jgi:hypothetical protein
MSNLAIRSGIENLEAAIQALPSEVQLGKKAFPLKHHVTSNGLYAREIILPAGTIIAGRIKKHEYISVLSAGLVTEVTEAGKQSIKAPYTFCCKEGTKRIVLVHETAVWTTIHRVPPELTELSDLYNYIVAETYEEVEGYLEDLT